MKHDSTPARAKWTAWRPALAALAFHALSWVQAGAAEVDPVRHWAFQPVRDPAPPRVVNEAWCRTSVDRFVAARWEAAGIRPEPAADRRTLVRRATFGLTGLPPSAEDMASMERDAGEGAWSELVERLFRSPRYGEHWGRHWLDVVRYADTAGETADYPVPVAWRYRNYVVDAFNSDKPYDEFLREQIAGDILAREGPRERYAERVIATGFLAISRRFGFDSENYHHLTLQDTIDTVGQGVLGLTLGCARCHAHKYDPVSMPEYYALYGIFDSTRYAFPGSEQKQRHRALAPLLPPQESKPRWREFETRVASMVRTLEKHKVAVPNGVLRSIDEMDGDFEMQAPAAGGSKGVLVPPWVFDGPIAVTTEAQSPFRNLHPLGRVGASLAEGSIPYRVGQSLHPARRRGEAGVLHVNLDFRVLSGTNTGGPAGRHRFWLGAGPSQPAVELLFDASSVVVRTGTREDSVATLEPGVWHNLQLDLDLAEGVVSGRVGRPGAVTAWARRPLSAAWGGSLDFVSLDAAEPAAAWRPAVAWDNLAVDEQEIPPVSTAPAGSEPEAGGPDPEQLRESWRRLVGMDGDFELQEDGRPPAAPWGPGPKSTVLVSSAAQSPLADPAVGGVLGVRLPGGADYQGFGQTLPQRWDAAHHARLHAAFDFRVLSGEPPQEGSWRFYLGHGPGGSAAVELFMDGGNFYRRSGESRDRVAAVRNGEWCRIELELDLKARRYQGIFLQGVDRHAFDGALPSGWDGIIDYTFIDSYGHRGGDRPVLDADQYRVSAEKPGAALAAAGGMRKEEEARRAEARQLRRQLDEGAALAERTRRELEGLLAEGPFEMAYAVSEGTPRDARLHLRGEPDKPGDEVPRGYLSVLGGDRLPPATPGSGRRELAEWLTSPRNPLTARVMVNRIWQHHFGEALVRTPNDFGTRGQAPWDADLLDHLATEFMRQGWSIKAMHRLIMNSAVYQQRSRFSQMPVTFAHAGASGPEECPVMPDWKAPSTVPATEIATAAGGAGFTPFLRRRLGAEELRDSILKVSGELDETPGRGHAFPAPTSWGYTQHGPFSAVYDHTKRSLYLMSQRLKRHPFLALFDGADPNASTPVRRASTVPTQALYFLNDPVVHGMSERFAGRVLAEARDDGARVEAAFRRALARPPRPEERAEALEFLADYREALRGEGAGPDVEPAAHAALARVLFGSNEFLTVD